MFSVNQARQLYVVKNADSIDEWTPATMGAPAPKTPMYQTTSTDFMFAYDGERSDLVPLKNIEYIKLTRANAYRPKAQQFEIKPVLSSTQKMLASTPVVINIEVCNQAGFGDEESFIYFIPVKGATSVDTFGKEAMKAFANTVSRAAMGGRHELGFIAQADSTKGLIITAVVDKPEDARPDRSSLKAPLIKVWISADSYSFSNEQYTITQKDESELALKIVKSQIEAKYVDSKTPVRDTSTDAIVNYTYTLKSLTNKYVVKAMEWFYHKERGDLYGQALWPNDITFESKVDSDKYDILDIHYFYAGPNEDSRKSGKDLTIAAPSGKLNRVYEALAGKKAFTDTQATITIGDSIGDVVSESDDASNS